MKKHKTLALAAALLLAGVSAASAAGMANSAPNSAASNSLTLSSAQQKTAWNDLRGQNKQSAPSGFTATVGAAVPET